MVELGLGPGLLLFVDHEVDAFLVHLYLAAFVERRRLRSRALVQSAGDVVFLLAAAGLFEAEDAQEVATVDF